MERVTGIGGVFVEARDPEALDAGVPVDIDPESYPNGRFATVRDPEDNVVQQWEPAGADARGPA